MSQALVYLKKIVRKLDMFSPYPVFYSWVMSKNERAAFDRVISKSKNYLEFGAGGSTIRALQKSNTKIYSVESSLDWIQFMRNYIVVRFFENKRLTFFNVDIGKTKFWGYPDGESSKHLFPHYSESVFESLDSKSLDVVFIDGRFRVACTLSTILNLYPNTNHTILIHDFWIREEYHSVLKYLDLIEKVDTLGVFKIKEEIDIKEVKEEYEQFKFVPD